MRTQCSLIVNGQTIEASVGETIIDAALNGWVLVPHDCRSGQCESCRVTVVSGTVDDQGTADGRTVLACQATVAGDAEIRFDELPIPTKRSGVITEINSLSAHVVEVVMTTQSPLEYRPGQNVRLKILGFPAREYSPTFRLDGTLGKNELVFHVRRLPGGIVSTQLGNEIKPGHRAHVQGPFGQAYLREGGGPLILVAGGTGWAPIWSVARSARIKQRNRDIIVIAGSRDLENLYMQPALNWLIDDGVRDVFATAEIGATGLVLFGRPTHYLPLIGMEDTVYVAGPTGLVDTVKRKARSASARCYADPFLPSAIMPSFVDRFARLIRTGHVGRSHARSSS